MKRLLLFLGLNIIGFSQLKAQLGKDTFYFRDDMHLNYNLLLKLNDANQNQLRIIGVTKIGLDTASYTLEISSDSSFVNIKSTSSALVFGNFRYKTILGSTLDSTTVYFEKKSIPGDLYPGDCNKDNLVNHMDLLPIGLMFGQYGSPRNLADTNISFGVPKKVHNWFYEVRGINAKHADVDGNGLINENDIVQLRRNFGKDKGNYLPILSFASNEVKLVLSIPDTIKLNSSVGRISVPIVINSPGKISAYGLGFSYTVRVYDKNNITQSRFYPYTKYNRTNVWDEFSTLFLMDTVSYMEHVNIAYSKRNQSNGDIDPQGGIIDIIIEDVLIGIANPGDITHMNIYLKEVALIDKDYNTIPITPVSKRIYLQKATSSISNIDYMGWSVYPTKVEHSLIILNPMLRKANYMIYNSLGQLIASGPMSEKIELSTLSWSNGLYYIKNDLNSEVIKIQK
ncbi:MAG: hypothetical protein JNL75_05785 [Chitinophagales bacterium]|nr:hypothetical protein [Chitinophagales bacterium]